MNQRCHHKPHENETMTRKIHPTYFLCINTYVFYVLIVQPRMQSIHGYRDYSILQCALASWVGSRCHHKETALELVWNWTETTSCKGSPYGCFSLHMSTITVSTSVLINCTKEEYCPANRVFITQLMQPSMQCHNIVLWMETLTVI